MFSKIKIFVRLIFLSLIFHLISCETDEVPVVQTSHGPVRGLKEKSISEKEFYSYMNIPYARPPIRELRFMEPVLPEPWEEVLDATVMPRPCMQFGFFDIIQRTPEDERDFVSEDCLYLNVFTSKPNEPLAKQAVMVFIHGGAFIWGSAADAPPYALLNEDVVLVVMQYRLGALGFLSTEDSLMPGNMGLKDQQFALKWVKTNIFAFGGDPEKVTIFGESAGGASVHFQMFSPGSKDLFQRAIAQSGTALSPWATSDEHKSYAVNIGNAFSCSLEDGTNSYLKCMQNIAAKFIIQHTEESMTWGMSPLHVLPRVDGDFIPDDPSILLRNGKYNKVDLMTGITRDEGSLETLLMEIDPTMVTNLNNNFEHYGPISMYLGNVQNAEDVSRKVYQHYLGNKHFKITTESHDKLVKIYSDAYFGVGYYLSSLYHANDDSISLYLYELNHKGQRTLANLLSTSQTDFGVCHGDDLFYLFSGGLMFSLPLERDEDLKMRQIFISTWTNFAKYGNPTPSGSEFVWERATSTNFKHLNLIPSPEMEPTNKNETINFWLKLDLKKLENLHKDGVLIDFKRSGRSTLTKLEL